MVAWEKLRVLCLGGAGQTGKEVCRQLMEKGVEAVILHDLETPRCEAVIRDLRAAVPGAAGTELVASAGNLFHPASMGTWRFVPGGGRFPRVCRESPPPGGVAPEDRSDLLESLLDSRLGAFRPEIVRASLIWNLVENYRPQVIVDAINTATVLGYRGDTIQTGRDITELSHRILATLREGSADPLPVEALAGRAAALAPEASARLTRDLMRAWLASLRMTAFLDTAMLIRFVQCLHALFLGEGGTAVPGFQRYVKVHTTGLGGMGFNIRYTHGDTGEPGLSTKLLGKVCATGSFTQLLLTLAHTPGCDVRVVVPATLVGWVDPGDAQIRGERQRWDERGPLFDRGPLPLVDSEEPVPCDGSLSLFQALRDSDRRVSETGEVLEVPYLSSGENNPYAVEDIQAVSALGQMGCVTKEEVSLAVLDCIAGDSRYDILAAIDSALLLPTRSAAIERDRHIQSVRSRRPPGSRHRLPSVSLANLGPTTAKLLYEIEILRACFGTVERVAREATEMDMTLGACSYILEEGEGALLRRQILSLGIPIFLRKGPGKAGLLLGRRLLFPDPRDRAGLDRKLDPDDPVVQSWLARGWIDLSGPRMAWWKARFQEVDTSLRAEHPVFRDWFPPNEPFSAGRFLGYLYSISGGQRKEYM